MITNRNYCFHLASSVTVAEDKRLTFGKYPVSLPNRKDWSDLMSRFRDKVGGPAEGAERPCWSPDEYQQVLKAIGRALQQCRHVDDVDTFVERSRTLVLSALQAWSTARTLSDDDDETTTSTPCRTTPKRCGRNQRPRNYQFDAKTAAGDPFYSDGGSKPEIDDQIIRNRCQ